MAQLANSVFKEIPLSAVTRACVLMSALRDGPKNMKEISRATGWELRYAEQWMQKIRAAHLASGKRGPKGGYCLTELGMKASALDVAQALFGPQKNPLILAWDSIMPNQVARAYSDQNQAKAA